MQCGGDSIHKPIAYSSWKSILVEQSGFLVGRSINDNVLISSKISHYLKCNTRGDNGEAALKIDFSKAYDRVGWSYLFSTMKKIVTSIRYRLYHILLAILLM
jgi:hypothetical protein